MPTPNAPRAEAVVVRDDEAEQQPEADDVQADDGGGEAAHARPLGRGERGADAGRACVVLHRAGGAQPDEREVGEAGAVAERVAHGRADGVERGRRQRRARRRSPRRRRSRARGRRAGRGRGPWPRCTWRTRPSALERLEVAVRRGDIAAAGELLGAQRPSAANSACSNSRRALDRRRPMGADGGEGGRGGRRLHRRDEVWDGHESSPLVERPTRVARSGCYCARPTGADHREFADSARPRPLAALRGVNGRELGALAGGAGSAQRSSSCPKRQTARASAQVGDEEPTTM